MSGFKVFFGGRFHEEAGAAVFSRRSAVKTGGNSTLSSLAQALTVRLKPDRDFRRAAASANATEREQHVANST